MPSFSSEQAETRRAMLQANGGSGEAKMVDSHTLSKTVVTNVTKGGYPVIDFEDPGSKRQPSGPTKGVSAKQSIIARYLEAMERESTTKQSTEDLNYNTDTMDDDVEETFAANKNVDGPLDRHLFENDIYRHHATRDTVERTSKHHHHHQHHQHQPTSASSRVNPFVAVQHHTQSLSNQPTNLSNAMASRSKDRDLVHATLELLRRKVYTERQRARSSTRLEYSVDASSEYDTTQYQESERAKYDTTHQESEHANYTVQTRSEMVGARNTNLASKLRAQRPRSHTGTARQRANNDSLKPPRPRPWTGQPSARDKQQLRSLLEPVAASPRSDDSDHDNDTNDNNDDDNNNDNNNNDDDNDNTNDNDNNTDNNNENIRNSAAGPPMNAVHQLRLARSQEPL